MAKKRAVPRPARGLKPKRVDEARIQQLEAQAVDGARGRPINRRGTAATPYVRRDGVKTRTVSVAMPVTTATAAKLKAVEQGRSLSALVSEAVALYLQQV